MLKFIKHNMETIIGIEIFPLIAFLIFFIFFTGLLIFVWKMNKSHVEAMGNLPLEDDATFQPTTPTNQTPSQS